jgi:hypothetical protein
VPLWLRSRAWPSLEAVPEPYATPQHGDPKAPQCARDRSSWPFCPAGLNKGVGLFAREPDEQLEQQTSTARANFEYIPALDGMRAVAIVLVIGSHFGLDFFVPGGFGVTLFFFSAAF